MSVDEPPDNGQSKNGYRVVINQGRESDYVDFGGFRLSAGELFERIYPNPYVKEPVDSIYSRAFNDLMDARVRG